MSLVSKEGSRPLDLEVHVGYSSTMYHAAELLKGHAGVGWRVRPVLDVLHGVSAAGCIDPHDVPGQLAQMATVHLDDLAIALEVVSRTAQIYRDEPDIRIELEQVLLKHEVGSPPSIIPPLSYEPRTRDVGGAHLIAETPAFEAHFSVQMANDVPLPLPMQRLVAAIERRGVPVHQAVEFSEPPRVVLTSFFKSFEEMSGLFPTLFTNVGEALAELLPAARMVATAERIILCAQPV